VHRTAALVAAALLATAVIVAGPSPPPASAATTSRVAGDDRYATAAALSRSRFPAGVAFAFVVTGADFADALASGPAAAYAEAPVLLTAPDRLPQATIDELTRVQPKKIVLVGGTGAVSEGVRVELDRYDTGGGVSRITGATRFETTAAVSAATFPTSGTAYLANGFGFADALAGAPAAYRDRAPLLLTDTNAAPGPTLDEIRRLGAKRAVLLGGEASVGATVAEQLRRAGLDVVRLAGPDRAATSATISSLSFSPGVPRAYLAAGGSFADGLAAGPVAALVGGPVLLASANCISKPVADELARLDPSQVVVVGGAGAVGPAVEDLSVCPFAGAPVRVPTVTAVSTPAWDDDGPDPDVVRIDGTWWAFTTGTTWGNNLGALTSGAPNTGWRTVTGRTFGSTALSSVPGWQQPGSQWAPGVFSYGGHYVMWYAARLRSSGRSCISVATASTPRGPYTDTSSAPAICQPDGSIDPQPFVDADGSAWLHWKNNDELSATVSKVWAVRLGADGTSLAGPAIEVLAKNSQQFPWQTTVDNPQMVLVDGTYYLFHTGGDYQGNESYTVGYATCAGPTGPCTTRGPILSSYGSVVGPGGGTVVRDAAGQWWIGYHAWTSGCTDYGCGGKRKLYVSPLTFR
jgi:putative cell wall-binding protein